MNKMFLLVPLFLLCLTVTGMAETEEIALGKPVPDFSLNDNSNKSYTLSDYQGKFVVLEWTNPDCPFVKKHYNSNNMQKLQAHYTKKNVVWFSICSSAKGKQGHLTGEVLNKRLKKLKTAHTAYLIDSDGKVGRLYGAKTTPHLFIINPEGKLVYMGAIDDRPSTNSDDIAGATNYVQTALDELLAGNNVTSKATKSYGCSIKY